MGGWDIMTDTGQNVYLNLPMRNLQGEVLQAAGLMGEMTPIGYCCDAPPYLCQGCGDEMGFVFDGALHRDVMTRALAWIQEHPDWGQVGEWSSGSTDWEVALRILGDLKAMEEDYVIYLDDFGCHRGCQVRPPYRTPRNSGEIGPFIRGQLW